MGLFYVFLIPRADFFLCVSCLVQKVCVPFWVRGTIIPTTEGDSFGGEPSYADQKRKTDTKARLSNLGIVTRKTTIDAFFSNENNCRKAHRWNMTARPNGMAQILCIKKVVDHLISKRSLGCDEMCTRFPILYRVCPSIKVSKNTSANSF